MIQRVIRFAVVVGAVVVSTAAAAQEPTATKALGEDGQITLGVERVFGVGYAKEQGRDNGVTTFSLFGPLGFEVRTAPYSIPRFGIDYFAGGGVSLGVGGSLAVASSGNGNSMRVIGMNPRVGFAVQLGDGFALWPKVGLSYVSVNDGDRTGYLMAASVEAQFVASLSRQVGFTFTPQADIGVAGTSGDKVSQFGLQGGLLAWF